MPVWDYDLISNGGGPAGLSAGIYAGRALLQAARLKKLRHGGSWSWKAGGDHARSTASGDGTIAALAVARYLEELKQD